MALSSDHVNYLIFRYLQEAGHESTALAFARDWHRTPEFRDPERYPFAGVVRRNELVSIIQSGLHHDELEARVRKNHRKFQFTNVSASGEAAERNHAALFENGNVDSRPSSSAQRKSRPPPITRPPDDFPTPAPKRQRRSDGSEGVHLNGDAMDVDATSMSPDAAGDGDAASPAVASEPEMTDIPERYDSMDVAVQTEVKTGPKTVHMQWKVDKAGATIFHSVFNPNLDSSHMNTLLTVGDGLCRFYQIPQNLEDATQILTVDAPFLSPNAAVTASTWHPSGSTFTVAVDARHELSNSQHDSDQNIYTQAVKDGSVMQYLIPPLLDPKPLVLAIRYNEDGRLLLVVCTNGYRGLVLVYDSDKISTDAPHSRLEPVAWRVFEQKVLDAAWVEPRLFVVCGDNGLAEAYSLEPDQGVIDGEIDAAVISIQGLAEPLNWLSESDMHRAYDKVRVNDRYTLAALVSSEEKRMLVARFGGTRREISFDAATDLRGQLTAIATRPSPQVLLKSSVLENLHRPELIAATFQEGNCGLYLSTPATFDNTNGEIEAQAPQLSELLTLQLASGPALALAWSRDGAHLAVAGIDTVRIWDVEALVIRREDGRLEKRDKGSLKPLVTWPPDSSSFNANHGGKHGETMLTVAEVTEPCLSWSADGKSLAFGVDRDMAIIRFKPPLNSGRGGIVNGHVSP